MKITLVGPGALGCLFATFLARAGADIWLLDHNPQRALRLLSQGLCLVEGEKESVWPVHVTSDAEAIGTSQVVLFCVKSHDVGKVISKVEFLLGKNTLLIALQNGIGHHHALNTHFDVWVPAVTALGASMSKPGRVIHGGKGITSVGFAGTANKDMVEQLNGLVALLNRAGLQSVLSDDIAVPIWNKLLVNVGINALTALNDCPNGKLLDMPQALKKLELAVSEGAAVARAKGIKIVEDPVAMAKEVCKATSHNISSMLADVRKGRETEIDAINGALVVEAQALGIPAPVNNELVFAVKALTGKKL